VIVDLRCRITTKEGGAYFADRMRKAGRLSQMPALEKGTVEAFFEEIGEAGITTAVSTSGNSPGMRLGNKVMPDRTTPNDHLADVQRDNPGRFVAVAGIDAGNVFHNALEEIERCVKTLGMKAMFMEPGRSPGCMMDDRRLYPIYQLCDDLGIAVIIQTSGPLGGRTIDYAHPRYIDQVADDFPNLTIICGHGCYPYILEMIVVSGRRENVYPSPDFYITMMGSEHWVKAFNNNHFNLQNKILWGSAYPLIPIQPYVDAFFKLPWKEEALDKFLYKNALRALKLESDPVYKKMYNLPDTPEKAGGSLETPA